MVNIIEHAELEPMFRERACLYADAPAIAGGVFAHSSRRAEFGTQLPVGST